MSAIRGGGLAGIKKGCETHPGPLMVSPGRRRRRFFFFYSLVFVPPWRVSGRSLEERNAGERFTASPLLTCTPEGNAARPTM